MPTMLLNILKRVEPPEEEEEVQKRNSPLICH
jgi:hypothetical protein